MVAFSNPLPKVPLPDYVSFLEGKKSYIIAVLMIAVACLGEDVVNVELLLQGLGLAGLRSGIAKSS